MACMRMQLAMFGDAVLIWSAARAQAESMPGKASRMPDYSQLRTASTHPMKSFIRWSKNPNLEIHE